MVLKNAWRASYVLVILLHWIQIQVTQLGWLVVVRVKKAQ